MKITKTIAALTAIGAAQFLGPAHAGTWLVNSNLDDGSAGTLRWAIQQNNANPNANNYIDVEPPSTAMNQWVIKLNSLLPLIIGPVTIKANNSQVAVVLDGSLAISPGTPQPPSPQLALNGQNNPDGSNPAAQSPYGYSTGSPGTLQESCPGVLGSSTATSGTFIAFPQGDPTTYNNPTAGVYQQMLTKNSQTTTSVYFGPNVRPVYGPAFGVADSGYVDISGFEIHDFCSGFISLRSVHNHFHHNHIYYTSGIAGVALTGDMGDFAGSNTSFSQSNISEYNIIHDTGDGQESTRGSTGDTFQYNIGYERRDYVNYFPSYQALNGIATPGTRPGDNPYSQGTEFASGGLTVVEQGNNYSGYSDGFQQNAGQPVWAAGNIIIGVTYGVTHSAGTGFVGTLGTPAGNGNIITNTRQGVGSAKNSDYAVTNNRIYDNGQNMVSTPSSAGGTSSATSAATLGLSANSGNGVTPNNTAGVQNYPVLTATGSVWNPNNTLTLTGTLTQASTPNATFALQFYAGDNENPSGFGEGEVSLGTLSVTTNGSGVATFSFTGSGVPFGTSAYFTATATSAAGQTSEFSQALLLTRSSAQPVTGTGCSSYSGSGNLTVSGPCVLDAANIAGNVTVTSGGNLTTLGGTTISGNLQSTGGSLYLSSTSIGGNLSVDSVPAPATYSTGVTGLPLLVAGLPGLVVCGTTVGGSLQVIGGGAMAQIGSMVEATLTILNHQPVPATQCASNKIQGDLQVIGNAASVSIDSNQIGGNLLVQGTSVGWVEILGNSVGGNAQVLDNLGNALIMANVIPTGNLQCTGNGVVAGSQNFVGGAKQGQCVHTFPVAQAKSHDFTGNGKSDILWRDTSGNLGMWLLNGSTIASTPSLGAVPATWSVVGQRDFSSSGDSGILWRDNTGNLGMWLMNGSNVLSTAVIGNVPTTWAVAGTGDFNGDSYGDILWRDTSGNVGIWFMNGTTVASTAVVGQVPTNWSIVGSDIHGDIFWYNTTTNEVGMWVMNGTQIAKTVDFGAVPSTWKVAGIGDFDNNGSTDILWRDASGNVGIWLMNGSTILSSTVIGNVPLTWSVAQTGDYSGFGQSDILWQDASGNVGVWFMKGTTVSSTAMYGNVGTKWAVQSLNAE